MEIIKPYEKENQYTSTEGENKIAEVIHQEGDRNQDGRMTVDELYRLLLGQNARSDDRSSGFGQKFDQKGNVSDMKTIKEYWRCYFEKSLSYFM